MARMPTTDQLANILSELRDALNDLDHGALVIDRDDTGRQIGTHRTPNLGHLWILLSAARRDGYRTQSLAQGSPASVKDDEGMPMPPLSDPVGELAVTPVKVRDPMREHAERLVQGLADALGAMRKARGSLISAFRDDHTDAGTPACTSHAKAGLFEEAERTGRCMWCYRFWLVEKVTPPIDLIRAKNDGKRITKRMVDEAMRPKRPRRKVAS